MGMKQVTMSFDEDALAAASRLAAAERTTLNALFCRWLEDYAMGASRSEAVAERKRQTARAMATISELQQSVKSGGRKFTRDEMNER